MTLYVFSKVATLESAWTAWHSICVCWRSCAIFCSMAALWRSNSCVLSVMSSRPDWLSISTVLRKRRCRVKPLVESGTEPPERYTLLVGSKSAAGSEQEDKDGKDRDGVFKLETDDELRLVKADVPITFSSGGGRHELLCSRSLLKESECKTEWEWDRKWLSSCLFGSFSGTCVEIDISSLVSSVHTLLLSLCSSELPSLLVGGLSRFFLLRLGTILGYELRMGRYAFLLFLFLLSALCGSSVWTWSGETVPGCCNNRRLLWALVPSNPHKGWRTWSCPACLDFKMRDRKTEKI